MGSNKKASILVIVLLILGIASIATYFVLNKKIVDHPDDDLFDITEFINRNRIPTIKNQLENEKISYVNKTKNINISIQNGAVDFNRLDNEGEIKSYDINAKYLLANEHLDNGYIELLVLTNDDRAYIGILKIDNEDKLQFNGFTQVKTDAKIINITKASNIDDLYPDVYSGFYIIKENSQFYNIKYTLTDNKLNASTDKNYNEIYFFSDYILLKEYDDNVNLYVGILPTNQIFLYKYMFDTKDFLLIQINDENSKRVKASKMFTSYQKDDETLYIIDENYNILHLTAANKIVNNIVIASKYQNKKVIFSTSVKLEDYTQIIITYDDQIAEDFDCIKENNIYDKRIIGFN